MPTLRSQLPPLNSLVAFEAAARHLSFTRAGDELLVSREAVSRQIRLLEGHLGVKLFVRLHRALALTEAGAAFQAEVRQGLEAIARSAGAVRHDGQRPKVTITATIALASFWLTPRLSRFRAAYPGTEIRVVVSDAPGDMAAEGIDVGLRYGDGVWPGLAATRLFDIESFPVAAPGYLADHPPIRTPADLAGHTLLNLDGTPHAVEDWSWWLKGVGAPPPAAGDMLGFDSYANVIQAAVAGQGLALGYGGIIDLLLADGTLVRPLKSALSRGQAVHLVVPRTANPTPNVKAFCDWVLAEAGARP